MKTGIYVYAVLEKQSEKFKKTGLKAVESNGLLLVYKQVDAEAMSAEIEKALDNLTMIGKLLEEHEKVIDGLSVYGAVIPFRFGTVFKDTAAALKVLDEKDAFFQATLTKIASKEEWGVKLYKNDKTLKKYLSKKINPKEILSGTEYLQRVKEEREIDQRVLKLVDSIADEITSNAKELAALVSTTSSPSAQKDLLLSKSFLIPTKDRDVFKNKMSSLKKKYQAMGVSLEYSGPWPPYSFV